MSPVAVEFSKQSIDHAMWGSSSLVEEEGLAVMQQS